MKLYTRTPCHLKSEATNQSVYIADNKESYANKDAVLQQHLIEMTG
jgi:hypothetical protein